MMAERDAMLAERNAMLAERDAMLAEHDAIFKNYEEFLSTKPVFCIHSSVSDSIDDTPWNIPS